MSFEEQEARRISRAMNASLLVEVPTVEPKEYVIRPYTYGPKPLSIREKQMAVEDAELNALQSTV